MPRCLMLFPVLLAVCLLLSCDSVETVSPDDYGGWIEGYVTDGDPTDLDGRAVRVSHLDREGQATEYSTETDDAGYFRIGVPNGRALVRTNGSTTLYYTETGPVTTSLAADTLLIDGQRQRADFRCGRLRLVVADGIDHPEVWARVDLEYLAEEPEGLARVQALFGHEFEEEDGALAYTERMVPPGQALIQVHAEGTSTGFYLPGSFRMADADTFQALAGQVMEYSLVTPMPVTIAGQLDGIWAEFDYNPPVIAVVTDQGRSLMNATAAADGSFSFQIPAQGDFQLMSAVRDVMNQRVGPIHSFDDDGDGLADTYHLEPGQVISGLSRSFGGLRIGLQADDAIDEVMVTAFGEDGDDSPAWSLRFFLAGDLKIAGVSPGRYRLRFEVPGNFLPTFSGGTDRLETAAFLDVEAGQICDHGVVMRPGGRITGRLVPAEADQPLPSVFSLKVYRAGEEDDLPVAIFRSHGLPDDRFQVDLDTGEFRIQRLEAGDYQLLADFYTGSSSWYDGAETRSQADVVTVPAGGVVSDLVWHI